jgi:hypothetical protein
VLVVEGHRKARDRRRCRGVEGELHLEGTVRVRLPSGFGRVAAVLSADKPRGVAAASLGVAQIDPRRGREPGAGARQVRANDGAGRPRELHLSALQQQAPGTESLHRIHVVAHEQHGASPATGHLLHLAEAPLLKLGVADGEHLVDDEHLGLEMGRHREGEPHLHPARVPLDRRIQELADLGERHDLVELPVDLGLAHAENRAVHVDVFAAGELGVKAGADLEQRADPAPELNPPFGRGDDAGEDLEQGALAGAVPAHDARHLAHADLEGHVAQRPEEVVPGSPGLAAERRARRVDDLFP